MLKRLYEGEVSGMNFFIAIGVVIVAALLVAALVDYRRRKMGDTKSGRATRKSVVSQKADARKHAGRWGAGQGGWGGGWGN
jgi:hypothetical protein